MATTVGQLMVNEALPEDLRDDTRQLDKDAADALLKEVAARYPEKYREISHKLMQLGREASFVEGTTLRLSDTVPVIDKSEYIKHIDEQERRIRRDKTMTPEEKEKLLEEVYATVQQGITDQTFNEALATNNPFALQVKSKARGKKPQMTAILSTPSVYQDAQDRTIPVFIQRSYAEGLQPHEYWAATYGARKGIISTKFATRDAGYLGKQFNAAMADTVVTAEDCETPQGVPMPVEDSDNIGSLLAQPAGDFPAGTVVTRQVLNKIRKSKQDEIVVRSPMTCGTHDGMCKKCVGLREGGKFPEIGNHIGYNAANPVAERIAQGSLNQKHTGGQSEGGKRVFSGFDVVERMAQVPKHFPDRAAVAERDGKVDKIEPAPQGGYHIYIDGEEHYAAPDMELQVHEGDEVEAGDQISDGILNPADVVRHKGVGEGRRYFAKRFTQALRDSGYKVHRRNIEVLAASMINHVNVDDPDGQGEFLPGDTARYSRMAYGYKPRKSAMLNDPRKARGQYLEQPALHYSIGTRITKKMGDELHKHGIQQVMADKEPVGFSPNMVSLVKVPEHTDDWMARLGSNYLQKRLLEDVQRGSTADTRGIHPIPAIAKGTTLGEPKTKGEFTF